MILPKRNAEKIGEGVKGCRVIGVRNIQEAIRAFGTQKPQEKQT